MKIGRLLRSALLCAGTLQFAFAAEVRVLSAGAIEPGIRPTIAAFETSGGDTVALSFATAPQIRQRVEAGEAFDLVIAPPAALDALAAASKLGGADASQRVAIGSVGLGVAVRPGSWRPDISSADTFRRALLDADSLVFNRASTGLYVEGLLTRLGVANETAAKTTRYPDGASVMVHVLRGHGRELGLGAITEIALARDQGLVFVGPLPPALQNLTLYVASPTQARPAPAVQALLQQLASPAARAAFEAAGIAPSR